MATRDYVWRQWEIEYHTPGTTRWRTITTKGEYPSEEELEEIRRFPTAQPAVIVGMRRVLVPAQSA